MPLPPVRRSRANPTDRQTIVAISFRERRNEPKEIEFSRGTAHTLRGRIHRNPPICWPVAMAALTHVDAAADDSARPGSMMISLAVPDLIAFFTLPYPCLLIDINILSLFRRVQFR